VRIDPIVQAPEPSRVTAGLVTFEPGARSAWHTHPLGQTLIVTQGVGWTQCEGEPIVEIRAGDVIWCPPNHRHWHGATPTTAMAHIAITEQLNGKNVEWMEKVTDEQYRLDENIGAAAVNLTQQDLRAIGEAVSKISVVGDRYPATQAGMTGR
jgi:quercetin dioxygenase-like cupin family protein